MLHQSRYEGEEKDYGPSHLFSIYSSLFIIRALLMLLTKDKEQAFLFLKKKKAHYIPRILKHGVGPLKLADWNL